MGDKAAEEERMLIDGKSDGSDTAITGGGCI